MGGPGTGQDDPEPRAGLEEIIADIHEQVYGRYSGRLLDNG